jgi:hypothetical protein
MKPSARRVASRYTQALYIPGQVEDDGWEPGAVAPLESGDGDGSQVPPARDNNGNELPETGKTAANPLVREIGREFREEWSATHGGTYPGGRLKIKWTGSEEEGVTRFFEIWDGSTMLATGDAEEWGRHVNISLTGKTASRTATRNPDDWAAIFDSLRPGQSVWVAMTSVMGMSTRTDGTLQEWKVGRRSRSRKYGTEAITLMPLDGTKLPPHAAYRLRKRGDRVSASQGDMGLMLKALKA